MSDDVKDFAYYAKQAEQYVKDSFLEEDEPGQRSRYIARAHVFATLATGAPKPPTFIDPEPCGSLHPIGDEDGHVVLNSPAWCRYIHGHVGNHQCMAGHEWENKS